MHYRFSNFYVMYSMFCVLCTVYVLYMLYHHDPRGNMTTAKCLIHDHYGAIIIWLKYMSHDPIALWQQQSV